MDIRLRLREKLAQNVGQTGMNQQPDTSQGSQYQDNQQQQQQQIISPSDSLGEIVGGIVKYANMLVEWQQANAGQRSTVEDRNFQQQQQQPAPSANNPGQEQNSQQQPQKQQ